MYVYSCVYIKIYLSHFAVHLKRTRHYKSTVVILVAKLCPTLCDPWAVAGQAPLSMGFPRQEYWSG